MSKAIVIKGANFSANKIETVTLGTVIPCESLVLSQDSFSASEIGATATLTATKSPADTTDTVTWASSDESVATVANGVVTITGIGSVTITATCGSQTATCSVSCTVVIDASTLSRLNGHGITSTSLENNKPYVALNSNEKGMLFYDAENTLSGYPLYSTTESGYEAVYPIPIPANASRASVAFNTTKVRYAYIVFVNANEQATNTSSYTQKGCKAYSNITDSGTSPIVVDIPAGANALAIAAYCVSAASATTYSENDYVVTFT